MEEKIECAVSVGRYFKEVTNSRVIDAILDVMSTQIEAGAVPGVCAADWAQVMENLLTLRRKVAQQEPPSDLPDPTPAEAGVPRVSPQLQAAGLSMV